MAKIGFEISLRRDVSTVPAPIPLRLESLNMNMNMKKSHVQLAG